MTRALVKLSSYTTTHLSLSAQGVATSATEGMVRAIIAPCTSPNQILHFGTGLLTSLPGERRGSIHGSAG